MNNSDRKPEVLAKVKQGNSFHAARDEENAGEMLNRYTMSIICVAAFSAGFWAIACLSKVTYEEGPLTILKQLFVALMGH